MGATRNMHTNARSLKDKRRAEGAATDNNLLTGLVDFGVILSRAQWLGGDNLDSRGAAILDDDLLDLGVTNQV